MQLTPDELQLVHNSNKAISSMGNAHTKVRFDMPILAEQNDEMNAVHTTSKGFFIVLDANGFQPKDFKVTVARNSVLVSVRPRTSGTNYAGTGTILRKRYTIPSDVLLGSISTAFTDSGVLIIKGNRATLTKTDIPVHIDGNRLPKPSSESTNTNLHQQTIFPADPIKYNVSRSFDV